MPLLLSQADLKPLLRDPAGLRLVLQAIEDSVLQQARGEGGHATFLPFPLLNGPRMDVYTTSGPDAATVRVFPAGHGQWIADNQVMLLMDPASGALLAILAGDDLNALRTSVPAALGAISLAPAGAKSLCILGSGEQAAGHISCICAGLDSINDIRVFSPTPANRERFAREWSASLGKAVHATASMEAAVRGADIVAIAADLGGGTQGLQGEWFKPGAVVSNVVSAGLEGLDLRLIVPSMQRPQTVFPRWTRPPEAAPSPAKKPAADLASILKGEAKARERDSDIVHYSIAAPYGWDAAIMRWAYDWALANGAGTRIALSSAKA